MDSRGAEFVNQAFLDAYGAAPQAPAPTPTEPPVDVGWWVLGDTSATLDGNVPHSDDDFTLTLSCGPELRVALQFDGGRVLRPAHGTPAGQIRVGRWIRPRFDGAWNVSALWPLSRDYRTAYAADPGALVELLRGRSEIEFNASERSYYKAVGAAPLAGFGTVLSILPCVEP